VSLDPKWWQANLVEEEDDPEELAKALGLFEAENVNGLHLLEEGTHTFTLSDNRTFTIYASPYTPEFNGYAFPYDPEENRFGPGAEHPIPSHGVDIVMTHGLPLLPSHVAGYELDINGDGKHCGCPMLYKAVRQAKPRVHCFGHLHEGYGMQDVAWDTERVSEVSRDSKKPYVWKDGRTAFVNAAVMNHGEEKNSPWAVSLDLGCKS
jgi:hypothetical protein